MKRKNILLIAVAVVLALLPLAGCEKDDIIQPQAAPISDFRNIRVVDLQVTDDADLDGDLDVAGDATISGTTPLLTIGDAGAEDAAVVFDGNAQDFYIGLDDSADDLVIGKGSALGTTQAIAIDENLVTSFGVAGTGVDVYFQSGTSGDHLFWDASDEVLNVIGTNGQTALNVSDGNVVVADTLDVNGAVDMDGTGFDVAISAGWYIEGATEGILTTTGAGEDVVIEAAAGRVVVKGDEAVATGVYLDADDAAGTGATVAVGATGGFNVSGGVSSLLGGVTVSGWSAWTPATAITVTQGMTTFTPTGTFQPIGAAGAVSFTGIGGKAAGRLLLLYNEDNVTITITDTTTTMLTGNRALSQYDSLLLYCDGTNWIEIALGNP